MTRTLLISTYEQGHQPLGLAAPAAALRGAGHEVVARDLAVDSLDLETLATARLVAISAPMHTAARLGRRVAERVRALAPGAHLAWYGLYAAPLAEVLRARGLADSILGGEYEPALVELAGALADSSADPPGTVEGGTRLEFKRQLYPTPDRTGLPSLERYARVLREDGPHLAGYVEASRGCAHTCEHCPLTAVYAGRLRLVQLAPVLEDIAQQVAAGARHITFGDPDFLNAPAHSMAVVRGLHDAHPDVTFDITVKVEHLLEHGALLEELRALGCLFITSAFESTTDAVLERLAKGHTTADLDLALGAAARAGIVLRPTWMAFTPWTSLDAYLSMLEFIESRGLVRRMQPVQLGLRLLLPPGSPLVAAAEAERVLGPFDEEHLTYEWRHPDPRMDALQAALASLVEADDALHDHATEDPTRVFAKVKRAALAAAAGGDDGTDRPIEVAPQPEGFVPGLSEAWFC